MAAARARRIITYYNELAHPIEPSDDDEADDAILRDSAIDVIADMLHLIREIRGSTDAPYAYLVEAVVRYHAEARWER